MRLLKYILLPAAVLALASCAKTEGEEWDMIEQESLDLWMQQHRADGLADGTIEMLDDGMYFEWLKEPQNGYKPETGDWLKLMYRGTDLHNNVFVSLYEDEAKREGTFTYYSHYIPHYMPFASYSTITSYTTLTEGQYIALGKMSVGDSVRLYLPSKLAYLSDGKSFASTSNYRYPGSLTTVPGNTPVIIDMVLENVVIDERVHEQNLVRDKAAEWGIAAADTLSNNFYLQRIEEDLTEMVVMSDSSVYIQFTGRFLDGFLYQTNVDSIAVREWQKTTTNVPKIFYNRSNYTSSDYQVAPIIEMFGKGELRYNSKYRVVFTSDYGYGSTEQAPTTTSAVVYPYTPFMYEITTLPYNYDKEEDSD